MQPRQRDIRNLCPEAARNPFIPMIINPLYLHYLLNLPLTCGGCSSPSPFLLLSGAVGAKTHVGTDVSPNHPVFNARHGCDLRPLIQMENQNCRFPLSIARRGQQCAFANCPGSEVFLSRRALGRLAIALEAIERSECHEQKSKCFDHL